MGRQSLGHQSRKSQRCRQNIEKLDGGPRRPSADALAEWVYPWSKGLPYRRSNLAGDHVPVVQTQGFVRCSFGSYGISFFFVEIGNYLTGELLDSLLPRPMALAISSALRSYGPVGR